MDGFYMAFLEAKNSINLALSILVVSFSAKLQDDAAGVSPAPTEMMAIVNGFLATVKVAGQPRINLKESITDFFCSKKA
jgi:hypothetical protein